MKYTVIEDAPILIPNQSHLNFTTSSDVIKKGTILEGEEKKISGKRRGQPFVYRLFSTNNDQLIYLNKVKPMETEVQLGADAQVSPTKVDIMSKKSISKFTVGGAIIAGGGAFWYCKKKKFGNQKTAIITIVAAIAGYAAGHYSEKSGVFIKSSK